MMRVVLKDFQSHAETTLDIREGFVCAVGPTNAGKSSLVRAIRWLLYDSIRGSRFVRTGKSVASCSITFDDGVEIERVKGKSNRYRTNSTWFDAVGVGTPVEVVKATNIPQLQIDKDSFVELHVATQLKPPLLIMDTDSVKAKMLNVLTGGHVVDEGVRTTLNNIRSLDAEEKKLRSSIDATAVELSKLAGLEEKERRLLRVQQLLQEITMAQDRSYTLRKIIQTRATILASKNRLESALRNIESRRVAIQGQYQLLSELEQKLSLLRQMRRTRAQKIEIEHRYIILTNQVRDTENQILALPDTPCTACGQLITKEVREKHLHADRHTV